MEYAKDTSKLDKYMHNLVEEGLVKQIIPSRYIDAKIPNFAGAFLDYVDSPSYPIPQGALKRSKLPTFQVHMEKLSSIGDELCKRGLAWIQNLPWYNIETYTANQFMAYLAASLGKLPEIKSEPITDNTKNLSSFAPKYHPAGKLHPRIDEMRTIVLNQILPAPSSDINPREIANFKENHKRELTRFRNKVESFLISATAIEDLSLRMDNIKQFVAQTRDDVSELSELMKSRG